MSRPGELTRLYLANTAAHALLKAASALAGLWAARELVRSLGVVEFGLLTLSASLGGYLAFLGLGLPAGLVRQVADLKGRGLLGRLRRLVRGTAFLFSLIGIVGAAVLAGLALAGGHRVLAIPAGADPSARAVLLATAAVLAVSWPLSAFSATLTGLQRIPSLNAVTGAAALLAAAVSVATARSGAGAAAVILATGGVMAASGGVQVLLVRRALSPHRTTEERTEGTIRDELRPLFSFGAWVLALELAALIIYQTDQIVLGVLLSVESLTGYYVVAKLHNLLREANGTLCAALFPMIASEHARGNRAAAEQALYRGTRYSAAVIGPATLAAFLLAGPFIRIWMGEAFASLEPLAQAFVAYWALAVLTAFAGQVALGMGEAAILGRIALATAAVNLAVSIALVRTWGIGGVIAGTLCAYALAVPAQIALVFPRLGISRRRFVREVVAPVYGVVVPAGIAWWFLLRGIPSPGGPFSLAVQGAAIVASCWGALWFTAVDRRDRRRVLDLLPRPGVRTP